MRSRRQVESGAQDETPIPEPAALGRDSSEEVEELSVQSETPSTPVQPVGGMYGAYGAMLDAGSGARASSVGSGRSTGSSSAGVPSRYEAIAKVRGYDSE
jgi:hypothetical protein